MHPALARPTIAATRKRLDLIVDVVKSRLDFKSRNLLRVQKEVFEIRVEMYAV